MNNSLPPPSVTGDPGPTLGMASDPVDVNIGVVVSAVLGGVAVLVIFVVVLGYWWMHHYGAQEPSQQPQQQPSKRQASPDKGPIVRMAVVVVEPNGDIDLGASDDATYPSSRRNGSIDLEAQAGEGSTGRGRGDIDGAWGCELVAGAGKRGPARS